MAIRNGDKEVSMPESVRPDITNPDQNAVVKLYPNRRKKVYAIIGLSVGLILIMVFAVTIGSSGPTGI